MSAYNLFRRKGPDSLYCAVPEDRTLPRFVSAPAWEFSGRLDDCGARPFGFDTRAAAAGVRFNGFHLFPCFRPEHLSH